MTDNPRRILGRGVAPDALVFHRVSMRIPIGLAAFLTVIGLFTSKAASAPLEVPFDFTRSEVSIEVSIRGKVLNAIVDTGVDPSVIDIDDAVSLGLKVDRSVSGEAGGFGEGRGAMVLPATIDGLAIGGRRVATFDALASDTASYTSPGQPRIDAVLGYSFLSDKIVLIDYVAHKLVILDAPGEARSFVSACRAHWRIPLKTFESYPVIPDFRFGDTTGPVTLDTGSNGGIGLLPAALDLAGVPAALVDHGAESRRGARGESKVETYVLNQPVGFGPFILPAGQPVFVRKQKDDTAGRVANVGNALLAELKIKMLLDYRGRRMTFYGDCR
jgi:hypothetical protein